MDGGVQRKLRSLYLYFVSVLEIFYFQIDYFRIELVNLIKIEIINILLDILSVIQN